MRKPINIQRALDLAQNSAPSIGLAKCLAQLYKRDNRMMARFIDESGLDRRIAYSMLEIGKSVINLRVSDKRLERIGWTKLQVIGRHLTSENARDLLFAAESMTTHELKRKMRGDVPTSSLRCVQLYFNPKQYAELEKALLNHGAERHGRGLKRKEEAVMSMVRKLKRI